MSRILVNKLNLNRSLKANDDSLIASVVRSKSATQEFTLIDSIDLLDLYFADSIHYQSYLLLIKQGIRLYVTGVIRDEEIDYYPISLRITSNPIIPIVFPKTGVNYEWIDLRTKEGLVDKIFNNECSYAYKLIFSNSLRYPSYMVIPHVTGVNGVSGSALIWFGSATDEVPPITSELYTGSYKIEYDPAKSDLEIVESEIDQLLTVLGIDTSDGDNPSLGYNVSSEGNIIKFHSIYYNDYLDFNELDGAVLIPDEDMNNDLLVSATVGQELLEFRSLLVGPRLTDIKVKLTYNKLTSLYNCEVSLDAYTENILFNFNLGEYFIDNAFDDSKLLRLGLVNTDSVEPFSTSFKRKHPSLLEGFNEDPNKLIASYSDYDKSTYNIGFYLDDGFISPEYHMFLTELAKSKYAKSLLIVNPNNFTYRDKDAVAFCQSVMKSGNSLLSYIPFLLMYKFNNYLGSVNSYVITDGISSDFINSYTVLAESVSLDRLINASGTDAIFDIVVKEFIRRFDHRSESLISHDSDFYSKINSMITSILANLTLIDSAVISSLVINRNKLDLKLILTVSKLSRDKVQLNFNINL